MRRTLLFSVVLLAASVPATAAENLIEGGDFEQGMAGWSPFWSREPVGKADIDRSDAHGGRQAVRIEHAGERDWSLNQKRWVDVRPGQLFELTGWVKVAGDGDATLCVTLRDRKDSVLDWSFAPRTAKAGSDWKLLRSRFVVPAGAARLQARLIGHGRATVRFDDAGLTPAGSLDALRKGPLPESLALSNPALEVAFRPADATFRLTDRRNKTVWGQRPGGPLIVTAATKTDDRLDLELLDPAGLLALAAVVRLDAKRPELVVELSAKGALEGAVEFPQPFATRAGMELVLPVNEGIGYPADDASLEPMSYHLYGGHGLCMPWYGLVEGGRGVLAIVETPDDAAVKVPRLDGYLHLAPQWVPQKGQFGPARRVRYVVVGDGGYVAMAKRYREYAKSTGLFKSLAEKRKENPNVDLLVGAANVWCWDGDPVGVVRELQSAGVERILWSAQTSGENVRKLNALNVLTSRYDIYQDLMDPSVFPKLGSIHPDWTTAAWPKDIILGADGKPAHGWAVKGKDGAWYQCAMLCDRQAVPYARERVTADLATHPYRCRFIDTTTAAPWNECYAPAHPMTRSESRQFKMDLLRYMSKDSGLVTGSETGHDAAVPFVHYFEGMLSLGPYRIPDAGRDTGRILSEAPERVAKFQTGHAYRLPLWELVYHDCVVAQWYWGDYNNKITPLWDRRDLWNALYGTPPMFMFTRRDWQAHRARFVQSYRATTPVARATGYAEMTGHRRLTADHAVQQTTFANGVTVTVNFGDHAYKMADGTSLPPLGKRVTGLR
jgi:hypothetical protein